MLKTKRPIKAISFVLIFLMFIQTVSAGFTSFAGCGKVYVNGEAFSGTVAEAISAASNGGTVGIEGTVFTEPIGKRDGTLVNNVTICGVGEKSKLVLALDFIPQKDDNLDVLSIKGCNVTVKDLTIDARFFVDYPICVFCYTDNITIENVTVLHGIRGGINIMTDGNILFKDIRANYTMQGGFVFENCGDASAVKFENCSTKGNLYHAGLIVKNGYGSVTNLDATGLTCYEDCFAFHDRVAGTIFGEERPNLSITVPPLNSKGERISLKYGIYCPVEKAYHHIRFGMPETEIQTANAKTYTSKYGFDTVIYYDNVSLAEAALIDGDVYRIIDVQNPFVAWINRIVWRIIRTLLFFI